MNECQQHRYQSEEQETTRYFVHCVNDCLNSFKSPPEDNSRRCNIQVTMEDAFQLFQQRKNLESLFLVKKNAVLSQQDTALLAQSSFQTFLERNQEKDQYQYNYKQLQDITRGYFHQEMQSEIEIKPKQATPTQQTALFFNTRSSAYEQAHSSYHKELSQSQEQYQAEGYQNDSVIYHYQQQASFITPKQENAQFFQKNVPLYDTNKSNNNTNNYEDADADRKKDKLSSSSWQNYKKQQPLSNSECPDPSSTSFANFLQKQETYQTRKSQNAKREKERADRKLKASIQEKPSISKVSRQIVQMNSKYSSLSPSRRNVHDRLYFSKTQKLPDVLQKNILDAVVDVNKDNTFHPLIQKRSKSIKRTQQVDELLYEDAKRRRIKQYQQQQLASPSSPSSPNRHRSKYSNRKRDKILFGKFLREMQLIIYSLESARQVETTSLKLDIASLFEIMIKLGFVKCQINAAAHKSAISDSEIKLLFLTWTLLGGGGASEQSSVKLENLIYFCLIIQNLDEVLLNSKDEDKILARSVSDLSCFYPLKCLQIAKKIMLNKRESLIAQSSSEQSVNQLRDTELNVSLMKVCMRFDVNFQVGFFNEKSLWCVSQEDKKRIQNIFVDFFFNRLSYEQPSKQSQDHHCTFHPAIQEYSRSLATSYREKYIKNVIDISENNKQKIPIQLLDSKENDKIGHYDFQMLQKRTQQATLESKRKALQEVEIQLCSFSPSIIEIKKNNLNKKGSNSRKQSINNAIKKTDELFKQSKNTKNTQTNITNTINNNNNNYETAHHYQQNQKKLQDDIEFEKQKKECTFHPEINEFLLQPSQGGIIPRNVDKTIERMRKAQKYKEVLHQLKQTGSNNVHKKTLASMESASSSSNTTTCMISYNNSHGASSNTNNTMNSKFQQKPSRQLSQQKEEDQARPSQQQYFQFQLGSSQSCQRSIPQQKEQHSYNNAMQEIQYNYQKSDHKQIYENSGSTERRNVQEQCEPKEKTPMLFVDVILGGQRKQRIVVNEGDSPRELAEDFSKTHGLDQETTTKLHFLLENQIAGLLSRIDEEDNAFNLDYVD